MTLNYKFKQNIRSLMYLCIGLFLCKMAGQTVFSGDSVYFKVVLDTVNHSLHIEQNVNYHNVSGRPLSDIYFHAWANSYKNRKSPLVKRLMEDYKKDLYFAKPEDRGWIDLQSVKSDNQELRRYFLKDSIDILKVVLKEKLLAGQELNLHFVYTVKLPKDKFTQYGYRKNTYNLRYWYLSPAVVTGEGRILMNDLNMDDLYAAPFDCVLDIVLPDNYSAATGLAFVSEKESNHRKTIRFEGKRKTDLMFVLSRDKPTVRFHLKDLTVETDLQSRKIPYDKQKELLARISQFAKSELGPYPFKNILVAEMNYNKNPVYGINQLPSFLVPFSREFRWELKMFKAFIERYINTTLLVNKRRDLWLTGGLESYLLIGYVEKYYPDERLLGKLYKIWGLRFFNIVQKKFNYKYELVYMYMARQYLDQALSTTTDSLANFNRLMANKYKAALGFKYLNDYLGDSIVPQSIKQYYRTGKLKLTNSGFFKDILQNNTKKDLSWYFKDYIGSSKKIDHKIKSLHKKGDSLEIVIKNKRDFKGPVVLYGFKDNNIIYKKWLPKVDSTLKVTIDGSDIEKVVLNYENNYPEFNLRDNTRKSGSFNILDKPLKFQLFRDIEDPNYTQIFLLPKIKYNYYDGLITGLSFYNNTLLRKNFSFQVAPSYGFKSKSLTGSAGLSYTFLFERGPIRSIGTSIFWQYYHYDRDLAYRKFSPWTIMKFRKSNPRAVNSSSVLFAYNYIKRDLISNPDPDDPQGFDRLNLFKLRYSRSNPKLIHDLRWFVDLQGTVDFGKIGIDFRYRKLTNTNRRFDFRFFGGCFLYNHTLNDYFSFGVDGTNDYLFNYNFFGRSEESGFFSQQLAITDGGFKSKLKNQFANQWMLTNNVSVGVWKWIEVYGDIGLIKNRQQSPEFIYGSGIRLNFIHQLFEFYFPVYSNLGWEIAEADYFSKIRFVLVVKLNAIINFFRRGLF